MQFRTRINRTLDSKKRIVLPPGFRDVLLSRSKDGRMVLTTIQDQCLRGFALPDWELYEEDLKEKLDSPNLLERDFARLIWCGAVEMSADAQGRILLPKDHLEHSQISTEAVLVGLGDFFELWQPERLEEHKNKDFSGLAMRKKNPGQPPAAGDGEKKNNTSAPRKRPRPLLFRR
ncbi:MAG: division/cell wall cluster transcriptional repressor MraZ [Deltaproteobacteria bacterium]|jgi:MraZ protein|nr:division/cell wall cluster transcriptional repressor MraZ [Deltaproteobacteria bacterium]